MTKENSKTRTPRVGGNDYMDIVAVRSPRYSEGPPVTIVSHPRESTDSRARLAQACIEKWAMVCAEPNGEDSRGRQKLRRMTPKELVAHACDVAEEADKEFRARGWAFVVPEYEALLDAVKGVENGND